MPPKRKKQKLPLKVFLTDNYSRFASKFPFLKERQIKAKLHQAWRKQCQTLESREADTPKIEKRRIETISLLSEDENDRQDQPDKKCQSPLRTYSEYKCHKRKAQGLQTTCTSSKSQSSQCSTTCSAKNVDTMEEPKESFPSQKRKATELQDLFDQIHAEQLLIEPAEKYQEEKDQKSSDTVSGMFKWRADRKLGSQQSKDENSESRCLVSNEREGDSNFQSMFAGDEDIFA
ncbi:uncharacterized protein [Porites lutea]|uniref:uncharacterized protein n=1 Tax=Porites lutea TaxID=51062 RepID=UPI003CC512FD